MIKRKNKMLMLKGIPAAPGITIGRAYLLDSEEISVVKRRIRVEDIPAEVIRFRNALSKTKREILAIKEKISKEMGVEHGEIFSAHILVLEDVVLIDEVLARLKKEKVCVEAVFLEVIKKYINAFLKMDDEYLRERISDITDVGKRILKNIVGVQTNVLSELKKPAVVIAYDLSPSDTATMHKKNVIGFATDIGGRTSHTAIMAKSLEIPAVVGLEGVTKKVKNGDLIIVDGINGAVIIKPDRNTVRRYEAEKRAFATFEKTLAALRNLPAKTKDGHKVILSANIELPEEIPSLKYHGAEGIGLYRTEYFYMNKPGFPTEEEQYNSYKEVAEKMSPDSTIIRTLDLGGDKFLSQLDVPKEMNPYLGWRAIRFCLAKPDIFKIQLRAILRASVYGKLRIMYPMISGLEELRKANKILEEVKNELKRRRIAFDKDIEVGAMIEVPSAAITSDILADEVDFFSIGTNDLIQYALAVDRVNEKIAYLYEPAHPAVLRLVKNIIDNGHSKGIWVGMCGEMAAVPSLALVLLGMGLDEFSISPIVLPEIKKVIRSVTFNEAKRIAHKALTLSTGSEVESYVTSKLKELMPGFKSKMKISSGRQ